MPVWTARCRNQDPGCVSMGAIQRGTSWATIPKTLNRARTVHAPCAHRARTVRQRPHTLHSYLFKASPCSALQTDGQFFCMAGPHLCRNGTGCSLSARWAWLFRWLSPKLVSPLDRLFLHPLWVCGVAVPGIATGLSKDGAPVRPCVWGCLVVCLFVDKERGKVREQGNTDGIQVFRPLTRKA